MDSSNTSCYTSCFQVHVNGVGITTTVADTVYSVQASIEELRTFLASKSKKIVGLDCEWRPYEYCQPPNKVATLQLCSETICVIIQLFHLQYIPSSLVRFLMDPEITFVGVKIGEDAQKLRDDYGPLSVSKTTDIGDLAVSRGFGRLLLMLKPRLGLKDIAAEVAGIRMEKPLNVTRSDWQVRKLSDEQIKYACIDAYASYAIGCKLLIDNAVCSSEALFGY